MGFLMILDNIGDNWLAYMHLLWKAEFGVDLQA